MDAVMQHLSTLVPLAFGMVLGWFGHVLACRREREAREHSAKLAKVERLRGYEVFLLEKEQIVEASNPKDIPQQYFQRGGSLNAGVFRAEAAKVRRDFSDRETFNRLDDALGRLTPQALHGTPKSSRDVLADAIRALLIFTRAA